MHRTANLFRTTQMRRSRRLLLAILACTSSTAALAQEAPADSAGDTAATASQGPGEIVVTSTRQSQKLSTVPLSVAAYTQEDMDAQGVRNMDDITRLTPGLSLTPLGSGDVSGQNKTISIRGIASSVGSATTGIYIDDTPIQVRSLGNATSNVYPQVFDLERVEVLRGPQGTLFGAGAEGGAVRFITPEPNLNDLDVYIRSEIGFTEGGAPSYELGTALGGPLNDGGTLGVRVSGWYRRDGGFIDRVSPSDGSVLDKNSNSQDSFVVRGALKWAPGDRFSATASMMMQDISYDDASTYTASFSNPDAGELNGARTLATTTRDHFILPSLSLQYEADAFSIYSTTSYFDRKVDRNVDYSAFIASLLLGGPYGYGDGQYSSAALSDTQKSFTQELRIQSNPGGRLNWVAGVFYGKNKQTSYQYNYDPYFNDVWTSFGYSAFTLLNDESLFETSAKATDEQIAGFGQVDYEIVDNVKLTAGVRVAHVKLEAARLSQGPVAGGTISTEASQTENPVTPKFGISWQATPDTMFYASASKGYRIGGVNGAQNSLCSDALSEIGLTGTPSSYKSDTVWSYEGGVKSSLFGGLARIDASAFDIYWNNIQRGISLSSCGSGFITNFGDARSTGFDMSLSVFPADGLSLTGSVGYADARLTSDVMGSGTTVYGYKGDKIGGPPWTWTMSGQYELPLTDTKDLYMRADYQHVGAGADINYSVYGADSGIEPSEAFDQVSLRMGTQFSGVDVSVFVNNLLDEPPVLTMQRYSTAYDSFFQETTLRPRTWGLTASYRY